MWKKMKVEKERRKDGISSAGTTQKLPAAGQWLRWRDPGFWESRSFKSKAPCAVENLGCTPPLP